MLKKYISKYCNERELVNMREFVIDVENKWRLLSICSSFEGMMYMWLGKSFSSNGIGLWKLQMELFGWLKKLEQAEKELMPWSIFN